MYCEEQSRIKLLIAIICIFSTQFMIVTSLIPAKAFVIYISIIFIHSAEAFIQSDVQIKFKVLYW